MTAKIADLVYDLLFRVVDLQAVEDFLQNAESELERIKEGRLEEQLILLRMLRESHLDTIERRVGEAARRHSRRAAKASPEPVKTNVASSKKGQADLTTDLTTQLQRIRREIEEDLFRDIALAIGVQTSNRGGARDAAAVNAMAALKMQLDGVRASIPSDIVSTPALVAYAKKIIQNDIRVGGRESARWMAAFAELCILSRLNDDADLNADDETLREVLSEVGKLKDLAKDELTRCDPCTHFIVSRRWWPGPWDWEDICRELGLVNLQEAYQNLLIAVGQSSKPALNNAIMDVNKTPLARQLDRNIAAFAVEEPPWRYELICDLYNQRHKPPKSDDLEVETARQRVRQFQLRVSERIRLKILGSLSGVSATEQQIVGRRLNAPSWSWEMVRETHSITPNDEKVLRPGYEGTKSELSEKERRARVRSLVEAMSGEVLEAFEGSEKAATRTLLSYVASPAAPWAWAVIARELGISQKQAEDYFEECVDRVVKHW